MGCLKLLYKEKNYTGLKVVYSALYENENSCTGSYRFGFNGKEKDNEVMGEGNEYAYEYRIFNSRIGKFFSIDPWEKKYKWQTPYAYYSNSPIWKVDFKGMGDPTDKPEISSANASKNSNRFKLVKRHKTNGTSYYHTGVDIKTKNGDFIHAIKGGEVVAKSKIEYKENQYVKDGLGNTITIKSTLANGEVIYIQYAHLNKVEAYKIGQKVEENAKIGEAGSTGNPGLKPSGIWGIPESARHVHIEASTDGIFRGGQSRVSVEKYMDTKFDLNGNKIEGTGSKPPPAPISNVSGSPTQYY